MNMDDSELVELVELVEPINLEVARFIWKTTTYMPQGPVAVAWVDKLYGLESIRSKMPHVCCFRSQCSLKKSSPLD